MRLENWHLVASSWGMRLQGEVYDHPTKKDGTRCLTSPICGAHQRVVTTRSGSAYHLGEPLPSWVLAFADVGETLDAIEPMKRFFSSENG